MKEHRLAVLLCVLTFLLLLLGGTVHNTGSSLACPDWPLCYGTFFPEMKGGVAIEHSHRLLAGTVGLLTILLAVLIQKRRGGDRLLIRVAWIAVAAVVLQGLLGGITVIYKLPTLVSTAHLGLSFLFFMMVVWMAWKTTLSLTLPPQGGGDSIGEGKNNTPSLDGRGQGEGGRGWLVFVIVLVYLQSLLGAFVRHTGAGLICPDIPFCNGSPWPSDLHPIFRLHMAHRWLGVLTALMIFSLPIILWKKMHLRSIYRFTMGALFLVMLQIFLGVATIITQKGIVPLTAHLGVAALLLATLVSLWVHWEKPSGWPE